MADESTLYLVDSSAWIWALRKNPIRQIKDRIDVLLGADGIATTGLVKCEILAGAASKTEYDDLRVFFGALHYLDTTEEYWERAARLGFQLRRKGMTITTADLLIATIAAQTKSMLLHADKHFDYIANAGVGLRAESFTKSLPRRWGF